MSAPWERMTPGAAGWVELPMGVEAFVCRGDRKGPVAVVTAGIHGDEYEGPAAAARLARELAPGAVSGCVVIVPVANPTAWRAGLRVTPEDGKNLARTFPGNSQGTMTERLAASLFAWVARAEFLIDLHSGGVEYRFEPLAGFYGEPVETNPSFRAAQTFGLPWLWQLPETAGVLSSEMWRRGKTAIGCEYLGSGQLAADGVEAYARGIRSCLSAWGIVDGTSPAHPPGAVVQGDWILAEAGGLMTVDVHLGDFVHAGDRLGAICGERGEARQTLVAPHEGTALAVRSKAYIRKGDWAVLLTRYV